MRKPKVNNFWWEPVASTVNVKKWRRHMIAVDGLIYGLAMIFNWPCNEVEYPAKDDEGTE